MLENNQIWENDEYVLKIEQWNNDFHALIFKKDGITLRFINVMMDRDTRLEKVIKKMELTISKKIITLRDNHEKSL